MMVDRGPRGFAAAISQRERTVLRRVEFDEVLVVYVDVGEKSVRDRQREVIVVAGDLIVIPRGRVLDITNTPRTAAVDGFYRARTLILSTEALDAEWLSIRVPRTEIEEVLVVHAPSRDMCDAFARAHDAVCRRDDLPRAIVQHRLLEIILWIEEATGRRPALAGTNHATFARKVRLIVATDLTHKWQCAEVAARLAVSDATLRRRLRDEATSFAEQVLEVRLMRALELLQSTDLPVSAIAAAVGYESPSRFAERFRDRFGTPPSIFRAERTI